MVNIVAKYRKYAEYKNSEIEWLEKIPSHWKVIRLKFLATIKNGQDYKHVQSESGFPVMGSGGQFTFSKECMFDKPSVLLGRKGTIDKPLFIDEPFWTVDTMYYTDVQKEIDAKYFYYLAKTILFDRYATNTALPSMTQENLNNFEFAIPNCSDERKSIRYFLDHETAKIDSLIEKQQKLIELLQEKRQAVISHAVTKGLNPDVTMKDSGVEWLGQVPEHWIIKANKFLLDFITSGSRGWAQYYADSGALFFRIANLTRDTIEPKLESLQYVEPPKGSEGERSKIKLDDLLISITADLGSICVADSTIENGYVSQHVSLCRPKNMYKSRWLAYSILSNSSKEQLLGFGYGGTKIQLSLEDIKEVVIAVPPQQEQVEIVKYIDGKLNQLECLIKNANRLVSTLSERRTAIISAAVTGKIDVRNWQTPDEAAAIHTV